MTDEKIEIGSSLAYEDFCDRLNSPTGTDLMFAHDALGRSGLEVVWLKLCLLAEIVRISCDTRINLNRCKIKLVATTTHLPQFWNFSIEYSSATDASPQIVLQELALCWFRTLLANPRQAAAEVESVLASLLAVSVGNSNLLIEAAMRAPALQSREIPNDLWQRVLQIGLRLATRIPNFSYSSKEEDSVPAVLGRVLMDIEALRTRVATALFVEPPRMEQDLGELLNELIGDPLWLDSLAGASVAPAAVPVSLPPVLTIAAVQPEHEPDMESTIIMKRGSTAPSAPAPVSTPAAPASAAPPPAASAVEENLEATIIISKEKKR